MPRIAVAANSAWNIVNYRSGLIAELLAHGHEVAVIAPDGAEAEAVRALGASFHPLPMAPRGTSPLADLRLLAGFRALLRRLQPDAFLGFTAKPNIWGVIAARSLKIPVFANVSGLGAVFARKGPLRFVVEALYRVALRAPATVLFQNPDDRELFIDLEIVEPDRALLLPGSGVDLERFAPALGDRAGAAPFTFLFAGRLLWAKGIAELVEAGGILRGQGRRVSVKILGPLEAPARNAVPHSALERWSSAGEATYLGQASDVRPAIAQADCVVLPSYYPEGVPHILLEAAAMARPAITTDMPGCRRAVEDEKNGYLCKPRSAVSLARAMARMMDLDRTEREAMGMAGRIKMEREFDQRVVHSIYVDALARSGIV